MKELNALIQDATELHALKPIKKQQRFIGRLLLKPGQKCFELNYITGKISVISIEDFEEVNVDYMGKNRVIKKLIIKDNCTYVPAINKENAVRKFKKYLMKCQS